MKWNEVTWYSKLAAVIFFLGVFPALTFYIGTQYQEVKMNHVQTIPENIIKDKIAEEDISSQHLSQTKNSIVATSSASDIPEKTKFKGVILTDDFISAETDKILEPFFGPREGNEYPLLLYYDENVSLVQYVSHAGKWCGQISVYVNGTKNELYRSNDDCYIVFKDTSRIVLAGIKNIKVWNIGDTNFKDVPGAALPATETYSSGTGCMGECIETNMIEGAIAARVYEYNSSENQASERVLIKTVKY